MPERALANKARYGKQGISCQDNPVNPLHPLRQLNQLCYFLFDLQYKINKLFILTRDVSQTVHFGDNSQPLQSNKSFNRS